MSNSVSGVVWRKWRVRELMDQAGYKTIAALADHIGVSRQSLTEAVNGNVEPSLAVTLAVASALGVKIEDFVEAVPGRAIPKDTGRSSKPAPGLMVAPALSSVG